MKTLISVCVLTGVLATAITAPQQPTLKFKDIKPILDKRCVSCHGASYPGGGIRLDTYEGLMKGGGRGKAVIPKNSAKSLLLQMIKGTVQPRMPMDAKPLTQAEMEKISKWITQGAAK